MRKLCFLVCFIIFFYFLNHAFNSWKSFVSVKEENLLLLEEIRKSRNSIKYLNAFLDAPINSLNNAYKFINNQLNEFSRFYNFKFTTESKDINKEGFLNPSPSIWPGIEQISLNIVFLDIQDMDQCVRILQFLEMISREGYLRILNIVHKKDFIEVELRIYGRTL